MNTELKNQFVIKKVVIDEANNSGLKLNEEVYATGWAGSDYTHDINNANFYDDIETAKVNAKEIYKQGDFVPYIYEVHRILGANIYIDLNR